MCTPSLFILRGFRLTVDKIYLRHSISRRSFYDSLRVSVVIPLHSLRGSCVVSQSPYPCGGSHWRKKSGSRNDQGPVPGMSQSMDSFSLLWSFFGMFVCLFSLVTKLTTPETSSLLSQFITYFCFYFFIFSCKQILAIIM